MEDLESWEGSGVGSLRLDLGLGFACGIALCMYMFYLVTDYRLLPAMQATCKKLHIPDDVAGATLLGASLNAPELFTSAVSTFATHNDVGVGVVVGSFNFNIFMITGVTALVARRKLRSRQLKVEWLFLQRDVYFYAISVGLLVIFCRDEVLEW
jgi:Ca2+/Na+ antiporter